MKLMIGVRFPDPVPFFERILMSYRVSWEIEDIQEDTDVAAAKYALALLQSKDSGTHVFTIINEDTGEETQVDLEEEE